jgi:hypothetical protein
VTWITTVSELLVHAAAMHTGYTIEMIEFTGEAATVFAPSFGAFRTLMAAEQAAALRMALSAPRTNAVGYRILDQEQRPVRYWPSARTFLTF